MNAKELIQIVKLLTNFKKFIKNSVPIDSTEPNRI